ncbi:hypothetical protein [Bacillus pinisoli]|uniref:hypothetical protein n=1 Tax=Bacillus pinisoli TaxID=2901866 RepID=UPI001FF185A3|nr:hypothetical protein [Bacillus pinisoli]
MTTINLIKTFLITAIISLSWPYVSNADYTSEEFQRSYFDIGYKEVNAALQESRDHFKKDIALPVQIPSIEFTHSFGRFNNLDGDMNDGFEIEYLHINKPRNHYMIRVKPVKYGLPIMQEHIDQTFKLKDGSKAFYSTKIARGFNLLVFQKNGWQYVLNIDKGVSDLVTTDNLVEIADSIR